MGVIRLSVVLLLATVIVGEKVADLKLHFKRFINSDGDGSNGHCCDGKWGICQSNGCDHYFIICVDGPDSPSGTSSCKYLKLTSSTLFNSNENVFERYMAGLNNPMVIPFQDTVPRGVTLKVDVWDFDRIGRDEHVDSLRSYLHPVGIHGERLPVMVLGSSKTVLLLETELVCAPNWYGPNCHKKCIVQGNIARCDPRGHPVCNTGWGGTSCATPLERNECLLNLHNCHRHASCNDTKESFQCTCQTGFEGDGVTCTDIDECTAEGVDGCQAPAVCINTIGSFRCFCPQGYKRNGLTCEDINECLDEDYCGQGSSECINKVGSYECHCKNGYEKHHFSGRCQDIDECGIFGDALCHDNARCVNKPGSFGCECKPGYTTHNDRTGGLPMGRICRDIDECVDNTAECHSNATCINTVGSYTCRCKQNFFGDGKTSCRPSNRVIVTEEVNRN